MTNLVKRILSGFVYAIVIVIGTSSFGFSLLEDLNINISPKKLFFGFLLILYIITLLEGIFIMKYEQKIFAIITVIVASIPLYIISSNYFLNAMNFNFSFEKLMYVIPFIIALITVFRFNDELTHFDSSKIIFITSYIGIPFALALYLPNFESFNYNEVFFIFVLIWLSDSAAYFTGRKFGKRKLAPNISPKKTIEGLIGGIIFTLIGGIIIHLYGGYLRGNWIVIALIISIMAPLGDLAASKFKRTFNVKDSSNLIPGHGGFLDRLDSFISCVPIIYLYLLIESFIS